MVFGLKQQLQCGCVKSYPAPNRVELKKVKKTLISKTMILLGLSLATPSVLAEEDFSRSLASTDLWFSIAAAEPGIFSVVTDEIGDGALTYDIGMGEIRFMLSGSKFQTGVFDNPIFCFDDDLGQSSAVKLRVEDSNQHEVIESFGFSSALEYFLGDSIISITPSSNIDCFFTSEEDEFGLFGQPPAAPDGAEEGGIFKDAFAAFPELSIQFLDIPSGVEAGKPFQYRLRIENNGNGVASGVSFQEVFPHNASVFDATLSSGGWICVDNVAGLCPSEDGSGSIRFSDLEMPAGSRMTFFVSRAVSSDAVAGNSIHQYAGVVGRNGSFRQFDAVQESMLVIGEPAAIVFDVEPEPTIEEGGNLNVVIHVVDENGELVFGDNTTTVKLVLLDSDGEVVENPLVPETSVSEGALEISHSLDGISPGTGYRLRADGYNSDINDTFIRLSAPFNIE